MEYNLVEMWLRKDPVRWIAGALAGLFAGVVAMAVAALIASSIGLEPVFPLKLIGTILLGPSATEIGVTGGAITGAIIFESITLFLGVIYAHFVGSNKMSALLPMGLVWGVFSWIFIWNLFLQSFRPIFVARVSSSPVFLICIVFGLALASVKLFDRVLRGTKPAKSR
ncbi:MAG: hypothetical protein ABIQ95_11165 [Bdellovibrionia bacterium]